MDSGLVRDVKGNKIGLRKYINNRRKMRENVGLPLNRAGNLMTNDMEKTKILNALFVSAFTSKISIRKSQAPKTRRKFWSKGVLSSVQKDQVKEHLNKLDVPKTMGPNGLHP